MKIKQECIENSADFIEHDEFLKSRFKRTRSLGQSYEEHKKQLDETAKENEDFKDLDAKQISAKYYKKCKILQEMRQNIRDDQSSISYVSSEEGEDFVD